MATTPMTWWPTQGTNLISSKNLLIKLLIFKMANVQGWHQQHLHSEHCRRIAWYLFRVLHFLFTTGRFEHFHFPNQVLKSKNIWFHLLIRSLHKHDTTYYELSYDWNISALRVYSIACIVQICYKDAFSLTPQLHDEQTECWIHFAQYNFQTPLRNIIFPRCVKEQTSI